MQIGTKWTLLYCIRRPPGISKRKQSNDRREEWDNWGPRHADPLMRGPRVSERLYCRAFQTASSSLSTSIFFFPYHVVFLPLLCIRVVHRVLLLFAVPLLSLCPNGQIIQDGKTFLGIYLSFMGTALLFSSFAANPWSLSLAQRSLSLFWAAIAESE